MTDPWYYIDETELNAEEFERFIARVRNWRPRKMRTLRIVRMEKTQDGEIVWDDTGERADDIVLLCINPIVPTAEITGYVTFIRDHLVSRGEKLDITVQPELVRIVFGAKQ